MTYIGAAAIDTNTQGSWIGKYGNSGYRLYGFASHNTFIDSSPALPGIAHAGQDGIHHWEGNTSNIRFIQHPTGTPRNAGCIYRNGVMTISITPTEDFNGFFRTYAMDWDSLGRAQDVQLSIGGTSSGVTSLSDFSQGKWVSWEIECPANSTITLTVTYTGPAAYNSVISAVMLDVETNTHESNSLVGYWKFEDDGPTVVDEMGTHHGVAAGTPTFGYQGAFYQEKAVRFTTPDGVGMRTERIEIPDHPELLFTQGFTLECWVYIDTMQSDWVRLVGKGTSTLRTYGLWVNTNGTLLVQYGLTGAHSASSAAGVVTAGSWHHLVGAWDGAMLRCYRNGVQVGSSAATAAPPLSTSEFTIGSSMDMHSSLRGVLDEVKVYNYAISPATIATNANKRYAPQGLHSFLAGMDAGFRSYIQTANTANTIKARYEVWEVE